MKIATGQPTTPYGSMGGPIDGTIRYRGRLTHAERKHRQIIAAIECCETPDEVEDTLRDHDMEIDAMLLECPDYAEAIKEAADDHKAILMHGTSHADDAGAPAPIPATAQSLKKENIMFATNQTEGSKGPWMTWSSNGSAAKGFKPKSWVMRGKDENDEKFEKMIEGFANPCAFDLDSLKLGWEKDGAAGQAPDRRYSSHYSVAMPRPDESKKPSGAFQWSNCLQVRVAISKEQAVTWEQGSFGAYQAFTKLARQIEAQWDQSNNGAMLPVVQMTGVEERNLTSGSTNIPILDIIKWVPRPDCLKDDAPSIAVAAEPAPQPKAAEPEVGSVPADSTF